MTTSIPVRSGERVVAFDLETTGVDRAADRIVEFCFQEFDEDLAAVSAPWTRRVNPRMPIPHEATLIHGIRDEDVAAEAPFRAHAARIQRLVEGTVLVAYNHEFDRAILHRELVEAGQPGLPASQRFIDPFLIFRERDPQYSLENAARYYLGRSIRPHAAHSATEDVAVAVEVLRAQRAKHNLATLRDVVAWPDRTWLDPDRKLYVDAHGVARFAFGKNRDRPALDEAEYLRWMASEGASFDEATKAVARRLLGQP